MAEMPSDERRQIRLLAMAVGFLAAEMVAKNIMRESDAERLFGGLDTGSAASTELIDKLRSGYDARIAGRRSDGSQFS